MTLNQMSKELDYELARAGNDIMNSEFLGNMVLFGISLVVVLVVFAVILSEYEQAKRRYKYWKDKKNDQRNN